MARILVLSNMYPPHHYGGYELSCRDVVDRWRTRGHSVTVLTSDLRVAGVEDPPHEESRGVLRRLGIAFAAGDLDVPPRWRRPVRQWTDQRTLARAIDDVDPEVVSIWHMGAMATGLLTQLVRAGLPLVYVVCDDWLTYAPAIDPWMRQFVRRPTLGRVVERLSPLVATLPDLGTTGRFCFVSDLTRRRSVEHSPWEFPDSSVTFSGIDRRDFPPAAPATDRPWRGRLLHVGRIEQRKGLATAIQALRHLEGASLALLGRGDPDHEADLMALANELGVADRVAFEGMVDRADLARRYAEADAVLFPVDWDEPFGLVPIEAMACATPVVASGRGGVAEFFEDGGNVVLFPPGDDVALAAAVRRLSEDPALRARVVAGGLQLADRLTTDRLADVLEQEHLDARSHRPAS